MIKSIYKKRIETLRNDYAKLEKSVLSKKDVVDEYLLLKDDVVKEMETISKSENIEPNLKYIEINKKIKYIETIMSKISTIQEEIQYDLKALNSERDIIIESCVEEHSDIVREKVLMEIEYLFKK
jgi:hypothetical protein